MSNAGDQYRQNENEKHVIISISSDGETMGLSDSLKYTHISFVERFGGKLPDAKVPYNFGKSSHVYSMAVLNEYWKI